MLNELTAFVDGGPPRFLSHTLPEETPALSWFKADCSDMPRAPNTFLCSQISRQSRTATNQLMGGAYSNQMRKYTHPEVVC